MVPELCAQFASGLCFLVFSAYSLRSTQPQGCSLTEKEMASPWSPRKALDYSVHFCSCSYFKILFGQEGLRKQWAAGEKDLALKITPLLGWHRHLLSHAQICGHIARGVLEGCLMSQLRYVPACGILMGGEVTSCRLPKETNVTYVYECVCKHVPECAL